MKNVHMCKWSLLIAPLWHTSGYHIQELIMNTYSYCYCPYWSILSSSLFISSDWSCASEILTSGSPDFTTTTFFSLSNFVESSMDVSAGRVCRSFCLRVSPWKMSQKLLYSHRSYVHIDNVFIIKNSKIFYSWMYLSI